MSKSDYLYWLLVVSAALAYAIVRLQLLPVNNKNNKSRPNSLFCRCSSQMPSASSKRLACHGSFNQHKHRHIYQCIQSSIKASARSRIKFALILVELDCSPFSWNFLSARFLKRQLQQLELQFKSCSPVIEQSIRLAENRFAVLVTAAGAEDAAIVAQKLLRQLPCASRNKQKISASAGICHYQEQKETPELLFIRAEQALTQAQKLGRGYFCFFDEVGELLIQERHLQSNRLKLALQQDELCLYYQPVIAVESRQIVALEALIRWQHPQEGLIPPAHFIPLAEQSGLIVAIGEWVLRTACKQLQYWHNDGLAPLSVAVNVSARQLCRGDLLEIVRSSLAESGLQADNLELEITESLVMDNLDKTVAQLQHLQALGVEAVIDDFGTGHSSLNYLKNLPVKKLKIDRSFIRDIDSDLYDAAIVASVIKLAHELGLVVVAEGVECEAQYEKLKALGCDYAQGYLFGKPLAVSELTVLLKKSLRRENKNMVMTVSENSGVI